MSGVKTGTEKDKGNAAFKAGDYATAVGHYSAAILNDRKDFTLPLNRAAAYLKLGKNEDASRDCSTVLSLNPSNVKALFRRGQARVGLQMLTDAQNGAQTSFLGVFFSSAQSMFSTHMIDFDAALRIEPNNQAVKDELEKLRNLSKDKTLVKGKSAPSKVLETPTGVRRRVPITIIEQGSPSNSSQVSEPPKPESVVVSDAPEPPPGPSSSSAVPKTFQDAKRVRDEAKQLPARVGGGIFRASGKNTIFTPRTAVTTPHSTSTPPTSHSTINEKSVATLFDFNKAWLSLISSTDRFQLINRMSPSGYPSFFKTSLEPLLLVSIMQTYLDVIDADPNAVARVKESMEGFLHVPRISTIALFLSRKEKEVVLQVLKKLSDETLSNRWRGLLKC
ncbi:hypothetical protein L218DRAFT_160232 [Marasmius fiardii PR-910]|nr:hypothetical protein L218DRAFT_160232 [Marasmius fiardii PR-910]